MATSNSSHSEKMNRSYLPLALFVLCALVSTTVCDDETETLHELNGESSHHTGNAPQKRTLKLVKLKLLKKKLPWLLPSLLPEKKVVQLAAPLPVYKIHKYAGIEVKPIPTTEAPPPPPPAVYGPPPTEEPQPPPEVYGPPPSVYGPPPPPSELASKESTDALDFLSNLGSLLPTDGSSADGLLSALSLVGDGSIPLDAVETLSQIAKINPALVGSIVEGLKSKEKTKVAGIVGLLKAKAKKKKALKKLPFKILAAKAALAKKKLIAPVALVTGKVAKLGSEIPSKIAAIPSEIVSSVSSFVPSFSFWPSASAESGPYAPELSEPEDVSSLFSIDSLPSLPGLPILKHKGKYKLKKHHPYVSIKVPSTPAPVHAPHLAPVYGPPPPPVSSYGPPPPPSETYGPPPTPLTTYGAPSAPQATYGAPPPLSSYSVPQPPSPRLEPPPSTASHSAPAPRPVSNYNIPIGSFELETPVERQPSPPVNSYQVPVQSYQPNHFGASVPQQTRYLTPAGTTLSAPPPRTFSQQYYQQESPDSYLAASDNEEIEVDPKEVAPRGEHSFIESTEQKHPVYTPRHAGKHEAPAFNSSESHAAEHHVESSSTHVSTSSSNQMRMSPIQVEETHGEPHVRGEVFSAPLDDVSVEGARHQESSEKSNSGSQQ